MCEKGTTPSASRIGGRFSPAPPKYAPKGAPARNVARPTTCRNGSRGATGAPPIWMSSQSSGRHGRGARPPCSDEPAPEPVDRAEVDEGPAPGRLPEDRDPERRLVQHGLQRRARQAVELRQREVRLGRNAAPDRLDRAVGRLELGQAALDGPVLDGSRADRGQREHGGADRDPDRDHDRPLRVRLHAPQREPGGHEQPAAARTGARPAGLSGRRDGRHRQTISHGGPGARLRAVRGRSSAGRASGWQPEGQGFEPPRLHPQSRYVHAGHIRRCGTTSIWKGCIAHETASTEAAFACPRHRIYRPRRRARGNELRRCGPAGEQRRHEAVEERTR